MTYTPERIAEQAIQNGLRKMYPEIPESEWEGAWELTGKRGAYAALIESVTPEIERLTEEVTSWSDRYDILSRQLAEQAAEIERLTLLKSLTEETFARVLDTPGAGTRESGAARVRCTRSI